MKIQRDGVLALRVHARYRFPIFSQFVVISARIDVQKPAIVNSFTPNGKARPSFAEQITYATF